MGEQQWPAGHKRHYGAEQGNWHLRPTTPIAGRECARRVQLLQPLLLELLVQRVAGKRILGQHPWVEDTALLQRDHRRPQRIGDGTGRFRHALAARWRLPLPVVQRWQHSRVHAAINTADSRLAAATILLLLPRQLLRGKWIADNQPIDGILCQQLLLLLLL